MENKKQFLIPQAEIIHFISEDIITTSDVGGGNVATLPEYDPNNP